MSSGDNQPFQWQWSQVARGLLTRYPRDMDDILNDSQLSELLYLSFGYISEVILDIQRELSGIRHDYGNHWLSWGIYINNVIDGRLLVAENSKYSEFYWLDESGGLFDSRGRKVAAHPKDFIESIALNQRRISNV